MYWWIHQCVVCTPLNSTVFSRSQLNWGQPVGDWLWESCSSFQWCREGEGWGWKGEKQEWMRLGAKRWYLWSSVSWTVLSSVVVLDHLVECILGAALLFQQPYLDVGHEQASKPTKCQWAEALIVFIGGVVDTPNKAFFFSLASDFQHLYILLHIYTDF